ncbi:hypothetical protein AAG570_008468, partial [Ranatra chinensis]
KIPISFLQTLYTYPDNFRAFKALIAAQYSGGQVKLSPNFVFGETNKTPDFLKKFPLGKVPAFESADGQLITESNAIAYYVANEELRGKTDVEKAKIFQWMSFADNDLLPVMCTWVFPYMGIIDYNKKEVEGAKSELESALKFMNSHLLTRTYLVSESVTLADIVVTCTLLHLYQRVMEPNFRKAFPNVNRWFMTIINQPKVKAVIGDIKLCDKTPELPKKDKTPNKPARDQSSKKKDNKKQVQEKAPEAAAEELDETELALAAEPKSKDPFEALPKGTFNMDDFKRCYSNEEVSTSIPYFWEKFDADNYSIWLGEYKYNDELKKVFMSCNLITGMFQRLDKMRKNAFASVCLFGKDDDNTISGVWVWRGHDLAFQLSPDWQVDFESYQWSKLNPSDASHKKMVEDYLAWTGKDKDGRPFNQGKIFK